MFIAYLSKLATFNKRLRCTGNHTGSNSGLSSGSAIVMTWNQTEQSRVAKEPWDSSVYGYSVLSYDSFGPTGPRVVQAAADHFKLCVGTRDRVSRRLNLSAQTTSTHDLDVGCAALSLETGDTSHFQTAG